MTTKLAQALATVSRLPEHRQDELAAALLESATRALIEEKIAAGEASYAANGGSSAQDVFDRLAARYGY
jgi:hypothetical protein